MRYEKPGTHPKEKEKEKFSAIFDFRCSSCILLVVLQRLYNKNKYIIDPPFFLLAFSVILVLAVFCFGLKSPARKGYNLCPTHHPTHAALSAFVVSFQPVLFLFFVLLVRYPFW